MIPKIRRAIETASGEREVELPLWQMNRLWDEANAQKDGVILRRTDFRPLKDAVLQGPHIFVGNPLYKSPHHNCRTKADYDVIDIPAISDDYVPRSNFCRAVDDFEYRSQLTACRWDTTKSHVDFYRVAVRRRINLNTERSFIPALVPPQTAHVHGIESAAFASEDRMIEFHSFCVSLVADFLIKATGKADIQQSGVADFPWVDAGPTAQHRGLRLACLTSSYSDLWNRHATRFDVLPWSSKDARLQLEGPVEGPAAWNRTAGLRTEFARRMALIEIDVLVAQALGLTLDQLMEVYRIYFPILQQYEDGTWFDQNGRIVWTCSKGLPGVGWLDDRGKSPGRAAWEKILAENPSELTCTAIDDTMPGGPREVTRHFVGPFTQCDRIEDYKRAWAHFERLKSEEAA